MRMGWVVGNAGLWGTIIIVIIAHVISISTGLSISSISTDKKVGAGGVYYVLSRSMGLPIGGAIGLTLFVGTAFSIALYLIGFSESLNAYLGLDTTINGLRSSASLALLVLTIIAFISTSVALKTQFFILAAIIISLVSIFWGTSEYVPETVASFGGPDSASLEEVFAIYFPAVTGFTAGIAMSGDLSNPKKSIPSGTIAAIAVGFIVYIVLAFFISYNINSEMLLSDYNILMKIATHAPLVVAGIWGATLSSALGGILGGPRIFQAMSIDKITPAFFGKGVGKDNEPRNALILTVIIAEAGILIGELDLIARVVSMFYLAAYGFINISFFLERWASADFKPSFNVNKWIGMIGFIATFAVMFKLDMLAMIAAIVIIGGIYLWLARRQITLGTGDVWQSVWSTVVKTGLKKMDAKDDHKRNWKPNILLFSGNSAARPYLLEFSKSLAGQAGIVTNFDLIENKEAKVLFPKHKQSITDDILKKYDIFGRRIEVKNVFKGIENIATTFGFSGLDPNTALMGWARNTNDPIWFAQMTQKLIDLDYNVLYLDYDERWGFRKREKIDLWWRGISNNAELMLHLAKFISVSPEWRNANIRILLVNDNAVDRKIIENRIEKLLEEFRVQAEINVLRNSENRHFYDLMKVVSADADLVFIGIPNIASGEEASFVERTNNLVSVIGTTLLVKASSTFEVTQLGLKELDKTQELPTARQLLLPDLSIAEEEIFANAIYDLDDKFENSAQHFSDETLEVLKRHYLQFVSEIEEELKALYSELKSDNSNNPKNRLLETQQKIVNISEVFRTEELDLLTKVFFEGILSFVDKRNAIIENANKTLTFNIKSANGKGQKIKWKKALTYYHRAFGIHANLQALFDTGMAHLSLLGKSRRIINRNLGQLQNELSSSKDRNATIEIIANRTNDDFQSLRKLVQEIVQNPIYHIRKTDREICNKLVSQIPQQDFNGQLSAQNRTLSRKKTRLVRKAIEQYASDWERNQNLLHKRLEAGVLLASTGTGLKGHSYELIESIKKGFLRKLKANLTSIEKALQKIQSYLFEKAFDKLPSARIQFDEEDFTDTEQLFIKLEEVVAELSSRLPEDIELMNASSFNSFNENQQDEIGVDGLALDKISDYLMEINFVDPIRKKIIVYSNDMHLLNGNVSSLADLINYGIESAKTGTNLDDLKTVINESENKLKEAINGADILFQTFRSEVFERIEATESAMDIRNITEEAGFLAQYVRKESRRKGISKWLQKATKQVQGNVDKLEEFVSRRKMEVERVNFERHHVKNQSEASILRNFAEEIDLSSEIDAELPFYYKQLFSGKHLNPGKKINNRQRELEEATKALKHLRNGVSGGIMVTGESLSGKSFFSEHIAYQLIGGEVYHVRPSIGGSTDVGDIRKSFRSATGLKGSVSGMMRTMPKGSIFIINDIELWWQKTNGGALVIEALAKLIVDFGDRHYFIMNCNLSTYSILFQATGLKRCLVSTIILSPLSQEELRTVIWSRHKTGGLMLSYSGMHEEQLNEKVLNRLFSRIHNISNGHPGFALRLWLSSITAYHEGRIKLVTPSYIEFPDIESTDWKSMLLQFFLHQSLSRTRLTEIYEGESEEWIDGIIAELKQSGIISMPVKDVFVLKKVVKPFLENWLKENEMIST